MSMFSEFLDFLKFLFDSDTRTTLTAISKIASKKGHNWKSEVRTASAKFTGDETYKVNEFANYILNELQVIGIGTEGISQFETIFTELIHNAFQHGCKESSSCKIKVMCEYSRWFIMLEVSDTGKGFDFEEELNTEYDDLHGLKLIKNLAYKFKANRKGNILTVFLINKDNIETQTSIEKYKGKGILYVNIVSREKWHYLIESWEPLREVVESSSQNLVLIDCTKVRWVTKRASEADKIAKNFRGNPNRRYALVINLDSAGFKLSRLNSPNFRVFDSHQLEIAKQWLVSIKT
jgi:anti-sigma regulatory factor (Ser/Thr protein kinase)